MEMINYLTENGIKWIVDEREANRKFSSPLSQDEKEQLQLYFRPDTLDSVRVRKVPQLYNPDFYKVIEKTGQPIPLDFREMHGIAFNDTVLIATPKVSVEDWIPLLFHECVHVCQYQLLGVDTFIEEYVNGWANNDYQYKNIPLEEQAYELESKFRTVPYDPFDVEAMVKKRWGHLVKPPR